jgi:hypothetical protein
MLALAYVDLTTTTADELAAIYEDHGMQVRLRDDEDEPWHRATVQRNATACARPVKPPPADGRAIATLRRDEYSGVLCPDCFTPYEIALAAYANEREAAEYAAFKKRQESGLERIRNLPDSSNTNGNGDPK